MIDGADVVFDQYFKQPISVHDIESFQDAIERFRGVDVHGDNIVFTVFLLKCGNEFAPYLTKSTSDEYSFHKIHYRRIWR
ncbi:MAG: hypothetical protein UW62_C0009G0008 [Candidatus Collierbacteria bacterium GW2011_GWB1_44_35]|uniref:Uncharacterized protein n=1 Tax=Candidatus Collierbacteria bacterium GW2011_GWB1_44_35 TaxID=1618383 RepID=A0A0G1J9J8_9BACT|nr:MAG: hypothetical protein UW62_C0009G0008 [Candidatus Collierbacteria bacterium GW2011_GWB1_44_35]